MNFLSRLSERTGLPAAETEKMVNALSAIIAEKCSALDCVAIPLFGTFIPQKHDETIITDHTTGSRLLLPPEIVLTFKQSASLRKKLEK